MYFPEVFEDVTPQFHYHMYQEAENADRLQEQGFMGLVIAVPRGHAKSIIFTFIHPLHRIVYAQKKFIVIFGDTTDMAESNTNTIRQELENNELLRRDFGDLVGNPVRDGRKWTAGHFVTANGIRIMARGTGAAMRGIRRREARPDLFILDDCENDDMVYSPTERGRVGAWYRMAVIPALDPKRGTLIVVGTVLHFDSLLNNLLKQTDVYRTILYRAILSNGQPLWPARFSLTKLDQIKRTIGVWAFKTEYMNDPVNEELQAFPPKWWRFCNKGTELFYNREEQCWYFRESPLTLYAGVDPAIDEDVLDGCDSAIVVFGISEHKEIVVMRVIAGQFDWPAQVRRIIETLDTWEIERMGIETVAYQRVLKQEIVKHRGDTQIKGNTNTGSKYRRIVAMSVYWENGQVYLPLADSHDESAIAIMDGKYKLSEEMHRLYEQGIQYPSGAKVDILDALENGIQAAKSASHKFFDGYDPAGILPATGRKK